MVFPSSRFVHIKLFTESLFVYSAGVFFFVFRLCAFDHLLEEKMLLERKSSESVCQAADPISLVLYFN